MPQSRTKNKTNWTTFIPFSFHFWKLSRIRCIKPHSDHIKAISLFANVSWLFVSSFHSSGAVSTLRAIVLFSIISFIMKTVLFSSLKAFQPFWSTVELIEFCFLFHRMRIVPEFKHEYSSNKRTIVIVVIAETNESCTDSVNITATQWQWSCNSWNAIFLNWLITIAIGCADIAYY